MSYEPKVYRKQGGNEMVVASGGAITVESGGTLTVAGVTVDSSTLAMSGLTASAAELNLNDGATVGTAVASVTLVAGANKEEPLGMVATVSSKAVDFNVAAADSGTVFLITAANKTASLPATVAGLRYTFVVSAAALSAATGFSISPVAADKIMGSGITSADNKDLINDGATDTEGDCVTLVGDGANGWYILNSTGTWSREA